MKITEAFELYRTDWIVYTNQSPKTEESHEVAKRALLACIGDIDITELSREHVRTWHSYLMRTKRPNTVRNYIIKLRVVLAYLEREGYKTLSPLHVTVPQRQKSAPGYVTPDDVVEMIDATMRVNNRLNRARNAAIISLLWSSGLRVSELCGLTINDVMTDTFTVVGKSKDPRPSFIDARARRYITEYLKLRNVGYSTTSRGRIRSVRKEENERALFVTDLYQHRLSPNNVQEIVRNAARLAGLTKRVTPHTIRHGYATDLLNSNCNLYTLSKLMGHQNVDTTAQYLHLVDPQLREAHEKHHSVYPQP